MLHINMFIYTYLWAHKYTYMYVCIDLHIEKEPSNLTNHTYLYHTYIYIYFLYVKQVKESQIWEFSFHSSYSEFLSDLLLVNDVR